jgi:FkbM family methyltransferase
MISASTALKVVADEVSDLALDTMEVSLEGRTFQAIKSVGSADFEAFWTYFSRGLWEADTLAMIDAVDAEGTIFLDVGGWIGPTAFWAAFKQSRVITFEPDPVALKALRANIALNPELGRKITIVPAAVGLSAGDLDLYSARPGMSETSVFNTAERRGAIASFENRVSVPMVDLAQFIRELSPNEHKIFIKMDIEGAEFGVLPHLAGLVERYDITIAATLHGQNIVEDTPDRTAASRLLTVAKTLEPFKSLKWFKFDAGRFHEVAKFQYLVETLNGLGCDASFIVSKRDL